MTRLPPPIRFGFLVVASLVAGWRPLFDTFALALRRDEYTHILLILPISAALIYMERPSLQTDRKPDGRIGVALLLAGILLGLTSRLSAASDVRMFWGMVALVTWWLGSFALSFDARTFRSLLFPLCFLFWLVPLPTLELDKTIAFWQKGSALSASLLFSIMGVPVSQNGVVLSIPGLTLEVAQECSSLRSSLMLVVTSMVLAHLFLRSNWRKAVVILAAIPLSIAKNGVRIFTLAMLGTRVDPGFLHGNLHHHGGIVFFSMALVALLLLLWLLNRREQQLYEMGKYS
jgi:exosortase